MTKYEFNFSDKVEETAWLVENLIPHNQLSIILAQAGVGKSLFVEALAVNIVYGEDFCDFKTLDGDVLIIDQDTPEDTLTRRLIRFGNAFEKKPKHKLFVQSMRGLSLSDGTLLRVMKDYPTARLIIVDSLVTVSGKFSTNTADMAVLSKVKNQLVNGDRTILINHHISQKGEYPINILMNGETAALAMGASQIIQQVDSFFVIGATADKGVTDNIYMRPVSKRVSIPTGPIVFSLFQNENDSERIGFKGYYEPELDDVEDDILTLFKEQDSKRTVKEVYDTMGQKHGINNIRKALAQLEKKNKLKLSRHKSNLFKYSLP